MEAQELLDNNVNKAYLWRWNGPFASFRIVWLNGFVPEEDVGEEPFIVPKHLINMATADSYNEFWIGWKVGSTVPGMGFTLQLRLKREIGQ